MERSSRPAQDLIEEIASLKKRIRELERSERGCESREASSREGTAPKDTVPPYERPVPAVGDGSERRNAVGPLQWKTALLEAQMNTSIDGILVIDENNRRLVINQRIIEMWDVPRHILDDENDEALLNYVVGLVKYPEQFLGRVNYLYDHPHETSRDEIEFKNGMVLDRYSAPVLGEDGYHYGRIWTFRDITERKHAEKALMASEKRFRTFFNLPIVGFAMTAADSRWIHFNDRLCEMLGYSRDELERKTWIEITPPEDLARERPIFEDVVKGVRNTADVEKRYVRKDGSLINVFVSTQVVRNPDASVAYFASTIQDITAQKRAEEEILMEREKLRTLSDNAPFGMVLIDKDGRFTYVNTRFTRLFGYDLTDVPDGRTWFRKAYPDIEYRHAVISAWVEDFRDARPYERKPRVFTVTCGDETKKVIEFTPSMLASGDYLMTCEDITELIRLESQLRQAQRMESIGTLAGGIAHDFNNILTTLIGYASLIQTKMDKASPLRPYVDQIVSASRKGVDLTRSLLTFSRQQPLTLLPMDVNDAIRTTNPLLKRLLTEDIDLRTHLTEDDTVVMADRSQMDQILFNLVTNARDAMPEGGTLTVETDIVDMDDWFTEAHGFGEPGRYVLINVSDTGQGMDEATREKIFDPFFTTKETGKGTGLGLATVYGIVKQHNGYITVYSEPGQGTAFHIYLPAAMTRVDEEPDTVMPAGGGTETILIAEDDEEVRRIMREVLHEYGYNTVEAVDGEEAVDKFRLHRNIDLVILDSVMPRMNGREAFEKIRGIDPHIKVLFTSGYTKDIVLDKGIRDGEFDFISKPLTLDRFLQKVREILNK